MGTFENCMPNPWFSKATAKRRRVEPVGKEPLRALIFSTKSSEKLLNIPVDHSLISQLLTEYDSNA